MYNTCQILREDQRRSAHNGASDRPFDPSQKKKKNSRDSSVIATSNREFCVSVVWRHDMKEELLNSYICMCVFIVLYRVDASMLSSWWSLFQIIRAREIQNTDYNVFLVERRCIILTNYFRSLKINFAISMAATPKNVLVRAPCTFHHE